MINAVNLTNIININNISNCMACKLFNNCTHAFKNQSGQYCHDWIKYSMWLPCCCPIDSKCVNNANNCICKLLPKPQDTNNIHIIMYVVLGTIIVIILWLICSYYYDNSRNPSYNYNRVGMNRTSNNTSILMFSSDNYNNHNNHDSGNYISGDTGGNTGGDTGGDTGNYCTGDS
jgi:hypothetical protein